MEGEKFNLPAILEGPQVTLIFCDGCTLKVSVVFTDDRGVDRIMRTVFQVE